jgi:hypothetical protein
MPYANSIEDVIDLMDNIVRDCQQNRQRLGYFTVLYRTVTLIVKQRCDEGGFFEDDDRMRHLDTVFANYYFAALDNYRSSRPASACWTLSFDAAKDDHLILMQHLLLGMNAHISLDLGVATAEVAGGMMDDSLRRDFNRLNNLLAGLVNTVQDEIAGVSPLIGVLDTLLWRLDEYIVNYGMHFARDRALAFAHKLIDTPETDRPAAIQAQDRLIRDISQHIRRPSWLARPLVWLIWLQEQRHPHRIMAELAGEEWSEAMAQHVTDAVHRAQARGIDLTRSHVMPMVRIT